MAQLERHSSSSPGKGAAGHHRPGQDPLGRKEQWLAAPTFGDLAEHYLQHYAVKKKSGHRDAEYLRRDVLPHWGSQKAADIRRRDVLELIERKAEHAPISANRLLATVRKCFNWAISRDLLETNPCAQVPAPGVERQRDRVLNADEIRTFWKGLETARMSSEVKSILRLILITAQRPGEVCEVECANIENDWWIVPAEKAKNGLSHRVPLSSLALRELEPWCKPKGRWLFAANPRIRPIQVNALAHALRRHQHFGSNHFAPHDLRRTAATMMGSLGVNRFVLGRLLSHVETGVTSVYDRATYDHEKRAALQKLDHHLQRIISGRADPSKVVSIAGP